MPVELVPFGKRLGAVFARVGPLRALGNDATAAGGVSNNPAAAAEVRPAVGKNRFDGHGTEDGKVFLLGVGVHGFLLSRMLGSSHSWGTHTDRGCCALSLSARREYR
jgi:hypothetical protein